MTSSMCFSACDSSVSTSSVVFQPGAKTPDLDQEVWGNSQIHLSKKQTHDMIQSVFICCLGWEVTRRHCLSFKRSQAKTVEEVAVADTRMLNDTNPRPSVCADRGAFVSA